MWNLVRHLGGEEEAEKLKLPVKLMLPFFSSYFRHALTAESTLRSRTIPPTR